MDASHARSWTTLALTAGALLLTAPAAVAARPSITGGSRVAGTAEVGRTLTNTARWSGHPTVRYSWLRCTDVDLASPCTPVAGARTRTYRVAAADAGTFLRSRVRVSNAAGWASVTSAPTRKVIAPRATPPPPSSPPATPAPEFLDPFPVVRIRGWLTSAGVEIRALTVRAPAGARITVRCAGKRCPRRSWARSAALVHVTPYEVPLRAGTRLTVTVTKRGLVGKHTTITLRRGKPPLRRDRCLYPGKARPRACRTP